MEKKPPSQQELLSNFDVRTLARPFHLPRLGHPVIPSINTYLLTCPHNFLSIYSNLEAIFRVFFMVQFLKAACFFNFFLC